VLVTVGIPLSEGDMTNDRGTTITGGPPPATEEPPPFNPDPDLVTYHERDPKPGEVKVWTPDGDPSTG